jgi:hypothetical protein
MMQAFGGGRGRAPDVPVHGEIFTRSVRRDLTDLNRKYLELGLRADAGADPLFAWSVEVRREIQAAGPTVIERMAACPFALFEICFPSGSPLAGAEPGSELDRVEDPAPVGGQAGTRTAACIAFTHGALFTAWRLADSAPLAARIAFALSPAAELELNDTCPTRIAMLASHPGIVRARWPHEPRFWERLRNAAQADSSQSLQWAHCFGLCLIDGERLGAHTDDHEALDRRLRR